MKWRQPVSSSKTRRTTLWRLSHSSFVIGLKLRELSEVVSASNLTSFFFFSFSSFSLSFFSFFFIFFSLFFAFFFSFLFFLSSSLELDDELDEEEDEDLFRDLDFFFFLSFFAFLLFDLLSPLELELLDGDRFRDSVSLFDETPLFKLLESISNVNFFPNKKIDYKSIHYTIIFIQIYFLIYKLVEWVKKGQKYLDVNKTNSPKCAFWLVQILEGNSKRNWHVYAWSLGLSIHYIKTLYENKKKGVAIFNWKNVLLKLHFKMLWRMWFALLHYLRWKLIDLLQFEKPRKHFFG